MALENKDCDMTPFAMSEKPVKQHPLLMPVLWGASWLMTVRFGLRHIEKIDMEKVKPPYLVISTHQGFSDYFIAPRALFPHRANYVSDMEGFAGYGKWLYKHGGCIGKRRYVPDISVVKNIRYALFELKQSVVLFPESRHCDAGVTSTLPDNLGRMIKIFGVPIVLLTAHGSYLANPFWDEAHTRKTRISATLKLLHTAEELLTIPSEVLQQEISEALQYDEYHWQKENNIRIVEQERAKGLHLPLYQCIRCLSENKMQSKGTMLFCEHCGAQWQLDELGELRDVHPSLKGKSGKAIHIPDWYRFERTKTEKEIEDGSYQLDIPVRVEALPNEKGFVKLGTGRLKHTQKGYTLTLDKEDIALNDRFPLHFPSRLMPSCQTEYNYRERGKCIVLSTKNCCYYVYSDSPDFIVTKLEFATEYLYAKQKKFNKEHNK